MTFKKFLCPIDLSSIPFISSSTSKNDCFNWFDTTLRAPSDKLESSAPDNSFMSDKVFFVYLFQSISRRSNNHSLSSKDFIKSSSSWSSGINKFLFIFFIIYLLNHIAKTISSKEIPRSFFKSSFFSEFQLKYFMLKIYANVSLLSTDSPPIDRTLFLLQLLRILSRILFFGD